jgi:hypothetical protein
MSRYATRTQVSSERSRAEIERTLQRYGADSFGYGWEGPRAVVGFRLRGRMIRLTVPLPDKHDERFALTPTGRRRRRPEQALVEWELACRQRWRALALIIKAKLEAVECGVTTLEEEFLAYTLLPDGSTVGQVTLARIAKAYETGRMPALLPGLPAGKEVQDG